MDVPPQPQEPAAHVALDPPKSSHVKTNNACIKCSYNLQGLPINGVCPECATPVQDSLRGILLKYAGADYLATVRSGLSLISRSILIQFILMVVGFIGLFDPIAAIFGRAFLDPVFQAIMEALWCIPAVMSSVGHWRYTTPDPAYGGDEDPHSARKVLRIAVLAGVGVAVAQLLAFAVFLSGVPPAKLVLVSSVLRTVGLAGMVQGAVMYWACMQYTNWMGLRVPDAFVGRRTRVYRWLLPVLIAAGALFFLVPLIALALYWNIVSRMREHLDSIQATGHAAILGDTHD